MREALGQGVGVGGARQGIGGADYCVCPKCGFGVNHGRAGLGKSSPCSDRKCAKCGTAMKGTNTKPANLKESNIKLLEASTKSWATVDKSKLPRSCFLWIEDPDKKATWHLPVYEGSGGIDPKTGMYRSRGELNLNALRAASAAIAGARTGKAMRIPANVRSKLAAFLKTYKIGQFAESQEIKESGETDMLILSSLKEAQIDKEAKVIKDVVLLSRFSSNNREYAPGCLEKAKGLFEGIKAFLNHQTKRNQNEHRDVRDLIGTYRNVRVEEEKLKGDLHYLSGPLEPVVLSIAEMPEVAGNSIHAQGRYRRSTGKEIIEELTKAFSVDLVTEPATTASLFEQIDKEKEGGNMEWKDIDIAGLRANRADLSEVLLEEGVSSRDEEVRTLTEENDQLKKDVDVYKVKEVTAEKSTLIEKMVNESGLPKEAQTDTFKGILVAVQEKKDGDKVITVEDQVKVLIEDRKKLIGGKGVTNNTEKVIKEGDEVSKETFASMLK